VRLFAGDHFPRLAVQSGDLPRPWVMPIGLPRAHRDRLAVLLAQALRALEPELKLVQLRWAERHSLVSGRINLPSSVLVWWRIDAVPVVNPEAVVLDGSKMTPGLTLYDFDQEVSLPAEAWLGPLKIGVLHRVMDRLLDERPVGTHEEVADALRELSARLVSPIDLVDAAEAMVEVEAQGEGLDAAKAEAVGRVIAGRFTTGAAESAVRALVAIGRGEALGGEEYEALYKAGLADRGGVVPLLDVLRTEEMLRRALVQVVAQRRFEGSIAELAPGLFPDERRVSVQAGVDLVPPQTLSTSDEHSSSLPEPQAKIIRQAQEMIQRGDTEMGARVLLRALQQREDSAWTRDDLLAAGLLLLEVSTKDDVQHGENMDVASIERLAAIYDAASDLLERSGAVPEATVNALHGAGFTRILLHRWNEAAPLLEHGRSLAAASGYRMGLAVCLSSLATVMLMMGRANAALELAEEAAPHFRALGMRVSECATLKTVGHARMDLHQTEGARAAYEQALAALGDAKEPVTRGTILLSLGRLWKLEGSFKNARQAFEDALSLFRERSSRKNEAAAHEALGELSLSRSEPLRAREAYEEAVPLYHELGDQLGELTALARLGDVHASMNALALARDAYDAALELARELGNRSWEASLLFRRAAVRDRSGDREGAVREYEEALRVYEETGDLAAQARTMTALGDVELRLPERPGYRGEAARWFELAVARWRDAGDAAGLGESLYLLGMMRYFQDRTQEAKEALAEAHSIALANGNEVLAARVKALSDKLR
jgi:tetratricopeptide (TPR) repeat protein